MEEEKVVTETTETKEAEKKEPKYVPQPVGWLVFFGALAIALGVGFIVLH